jgi:beta-aspartyl-peptidase (threonine type)
MKTIFSLTVVLAAIAVFSLANHFPFNAAVGAAQAPPSGFVLVAHGGAGDYSNMKPEQVEMRRAAMLKAVQAGYTILAKKGSSLDAVEATIRVMEDSGLFDAGRGSYYTREGVPKMDAAIMDGRTLNAGSVASLKHVTNPIHLARLVMEKTPHGEGAEEFAKSQGIELVSPYSFFNEQERQIGRREEEIGEIFR